MKFAFTNLACPQWSIEQVAEAARRLGYDGVELRLLGGAVIDPVRDRAEVREAAGLLRDQGVEVCAFDTSCRLNQPEGEERSRQVEELLRWIDLAEELEVPILRVFGGEAPEDRPGEGNEQVAAALREVAPRAERAGVTVALETHDAFSSARRVAEVLRAVPSARVGALWDSHHPYRMGETPEEVLDLLEDRIVHVHVKDARRTAHPETSETVAPPQTGEWELVPVGEGEVPVEGQLRLLEQRGYMGYVSVEWEKKWHPEIAEPEVALPQHIEWLRGRTAR